MQEHDTTTDDDFEDDYDENAIMPPTPGPWTISEDNDWFIRISAPDPDPNNNLLGRLEVRVETDDIDERVSRANARLIAAAPALRDALLKLSYDEHCWCPWQWADGSHVPSCRQARAALAAASPPDAQTEGAP
jgi:hypothetical protein